MQTPFQKAIQAEFQSYDVWNSTLQKARNEIIKIRRKRDIIREKYKLNRFSRELRQKAFEAEQQLWSAETEYAHLIFASQREIHTSYISSLHGYHAPMGPNEMPLTPDNMTSFSSSE
jgi:hypothetical protein